MLGVRAVNRPLRIALALAALLVFAVISAGLARAFGAGTQEHALLVDLAGYEAAGNAAAVLRRTDGCRDHPACEAGVRRTTARARRPGKVRILNITNGTKLALEPGRREVRVAWKAGTALPVVQCATVQRSGSLISGFDVSLRAIRTIPRTVDC